MEFEPHETKNENYDASDIIVEQIANVYYSACACECGGNQRTGNCG